VAWGALVNGLQAGIRADATPGLTPGAADAWRTFGYYLRNCTNRPLLVALPDRVGSDWSLDVQDAAGDRVQVNGVDLYRSFIPLKNHLLAPGQCLRVASLILLLRDKAASALLGVGFVSTALVEPGAYTVSCCEAASWAAGGLPHMALPTGRVAIEVTASDLAR
jgi:hypothetical protein